MKLMPQHIPFKQLADMVEGRLQNDARAATDAHLAQCARCSRQAAQLEHVTTLMRTDTTEDVPQHVFASTVAMFRTRFIPEAATEKGRGLVRRILATLSFDSLSLAPAYGVRSGQAASARQLLFSAGEVDVDLRLAPGSEGWTVSGQVLGPCTGGRVEMADHEQTAAQSALNELCEFTLPPVPEGDYTLRLRIDDTEVEIPELHLRA